MIRNIIKHSNRVHFLSFFRILFIVISVAYLSSCANDDDPGTSPKVDEFLVSTTELETLTKEQIQLLVQLGGFSEFSDVITNGITVYRMVYNTNYKNETIEASGLLVIPDDTSQPLPLISAQHGTIFSNAEAPSEFSLSEGVSGFELFAATGFISIIPDFIGYGSSKDIVHPYYNAELTGAAIVDMILASKEFLDKSSIEYDDKLFLFGYSEGGYATVAAQKIIQENSQFGLTVTAAAAGAGGYDIEGVMMDIINRENYDSPGYLAFITYAAIVTNDWSNPLTDFFQEPYASRIPSLFDGSLSQSAVNAQLTESISDLFNPTLLENLKSGTMDLITDEFRLNSVHDWSPTATLRLYHSAGDDIIPINNSKDTANKMMANGANDVTFIEVGGDSHGAAVIPMLENAVPWLLSLK